ncbi:MAG: PEP-CTERM sorting domain-containing protein [Planctomycetales bacterium]|nr:PEP-CTERM sorting domain-containing protein [Planctomycetales bacterium]
MSRIFGAIFLLICFSITPIAHADFVAGDIQIVGFNSDNPDQIAFVNWVPLSEGTTLYFTDNGFYNSGNLRGGEGELSFDVATGGLPVGAVTVAELDLGLSTSGDQIFIGESAFPNSLDVAYPSADLVFGLNFDGTNWVTTATGTNDSALPPSLSTSIGNLDLGEAQNAIYTGPRIGLTIEAFQTEIANSLNWTTSTDAINLSAGGSFSAVPEPSAFLFGGIALGLVGAWRFAKRNWVAAE